MNEQQIDRGRLRDDIETGKRLTGTIDAGWEEDYYPAMARIFEALPQLLDQIDQQERELDAWMTRAYEAEKRAWQAEARIKAVRELCDTAPNGEDLDPLSSHYSSGYELALQDIRRALDGDQ